MNAYNFLAATWCPCIPWVLCGKKEAGAMNLKTGYPVKEANFPFVAFLRAAC